MYSLFSTVVSLHSPAYNATGSDTKGRARFARARGGAGLLGYHWFVNEEEKKKKKDKPAKVKRNKRRPSCCPMR